MQSKTTGSVLFPIVFGFFVIAGLIVCRLGLFECLLHSL